MITICRAEDGQVYQANASVRDIESIGSLELFLHQEIGIEEDAAIAYLSDGRRLTNGNIRDLGSSQDQTIYVFNKFYLDYDIDSVLQELHHEPPFHTPIEDATATTPPIRHAQLAASYARASQIHHEKIQNFLQSLRVQHTALQIASTNLDFHVLAISETFDGIAGGARSELEKQASLLNGLETDLELISRVGVHVEFCSAAVRMAIEAGDPQRVLGDYVSRQKMKNVADTCAHTHEELKVRFSHTEQSVTKVKEGADKVRTTASNVSLFDEANGCFRRSQDLLDRITDAAAALESPASDADVLLQDLRHLDNLHRQEVQQLTNNKNLYTHHCITALRHISSLNNEIIHLPPILASLQASFRAKTSFPHIQRLHNMLYAYGATIVEVVRRKEFSRFFYQRSQSILEVMAKLSASEKKRRQVYRGEVGGLLPFEIRGMDDPIPSIDFSPTGGLDSVYSFERADIDHVLHVLDELESYARTSDAPTAAKAIAECRASLEKLISKMDNLELGFDKIAERSLLSQSRISQVRRRSTEAEDRAIQELADELRTMQEAKAQQESLFQAEKSALQAEIHKLRNSSSEFNSTLSVEQERAARLERELHQVRAQMESEGVARRILEERNTELSADISKQRTEIARALADATEQTKEAEMLRQQLSQAQVDFEEVKALEKKNADLVNNLLEEQANSLRHLEEARARGEDLETQIQAARSESEDVVQALKKASEEKDKLLKAQASEHDRIIRDHIAEADGDRAVLDRQFSELQAVLEHNERQLKDLRGDLEVANADAVGLREELQRVTHELREARHVERLLRDDLKAGRASQQDFETRMEEGNRLIAQILDVAISFRNSHVKALHTAQSTAIHPSSARHNAASNNLSESTFSVSFRHNVIGQHDEPSPIDPGDPTAALDILREFDHDHFLEAVTKTGTTIRKWQKQCKEYRERSKGKISFRNFAKGDLALFLPTRNSVSKPWAAFNVSFPHYFLQATGHLAEQLKTREWIVARITSITERVVDQKDPSSNPYGLGDGVKYYMLEVEDWTQPTHNKRRLSSRKISSGESNEPKDVFPPTHSKLSPSALPPGPPEGEVEDTFLVTHPNSHLFPTRGRSNSSPTARPSSLSRLLAQASPVTENPPAAAPEINRSPSPPFSPPPPPSPSLHTGSVPQSANNNIPMNHNITPSVPSASPLRPGSRSSRLSTTSRFSVSRIPALGTVASSQPSKAAPTTAITDQVMAVSSPSSDNPFMSPVTPSSEESITDAMSSAMNQSRRRKTSHQAPRASPLASGSSQSTVVPPSVTSVVATPPSIVTTTNAFANLASSWGMSFGKKKKGELGGNGGGSSLASTLESPRDASPSEQLPAATKDVNARDLLRRF
ncbi:hypothetical protein M413DRAFT_267979 [Hebeloma cylindrosporum]|uniref:Autophagy-related protein 11 n=1 Tax=Hebeloma cylindrosporum TaxID=76867 RepID=A0A0C3CSY9_HEBCY|nr:hypothetical protein M413DRAFT_267979 [Hebeloma cylindrosporum h7]